MASTTSVTVPSVSDDTLVYDTNVPEGVSGQDAILLLRARKSAAKREATRKARELAIAEQGRPDNASFVLLKTITASLQGAVKAYEGNPEGLSDYVLRLAGMTDAATAVESTKMAAHFSTVGTFIDRLYPPVVAS